MGGADYWGVLGRVAFAMSSGRELGVTLES